MNPRETPMNTPQPKGANAHIWEQVAREAIEAQLASERRAALLEQLLESASEESASWKREFLQTETELFKLRLRNLNDLGNPQAAQISESTLDQLDAFDDAQLRQFVKVLRRFLRRDETAAVADAIRWVQGNRAPTSEPPEPPPRLCPDCRLRPIPAQTGRGRPFERCAECARERELAKNRERVAAHRARKPP